MQKFSFPKMPWRDLAEMGARARAFGAGEVNLSSNSELWTVPDSNRSPPHCKCGALPNELTAREQVVDYRF